MNMSGIENWAGTGTKTGWYTVVGNGKKGASLVPIYKILESIYKGRTSAMDFKGTSSVLSFSLEEPHDSSTLAFYKLPSSGLKSQL